jgi:hypothetical protein
MGVELDLKKMADMTVDDMIQKQNVLYISRGQLKKHTSTVLNISLNVRYISQQVSIVLYVSDQTGCQLLSITLCMSAAASFTLVWPHSITLSLQCLLWWQFIHTASHCQHF